MESLIREEKELKKILFNNFRGTTKYRPFLIRPHILDAEMLESHYQVGPSPP